MVNLKNSIVATLICIFNFGCQSNGNYKIQTAHIESLDFQVIKVSSNRISQKCIFLDAEAENSWRHQYLMFILNDKNEALEVAHAHNMGIESCREHVAGVEKILKSGPIVSICSRGGLINKGSSDDVSWEDKADFGRLGIHKVEYKSLTFDTICNSKKCFGDNSAYTYTCPGFVKQ